MNYKILGDKAYAKSLANRVKEKEYQMLQYKAKEYSIVSPTVAEDVIKEGESLSHCVASYVKDIAKGLCKIVFLRKTKHLEESCVTIEVRGNSIRQVRGSNNRVPTKDEKDFVLQWAEEKKLIPSF
jgi:hypoxanthine-guanine phosphoribosyltransferase